MREWVIRSNFFWLKSYSFVCFIYVFLLKKIINSLIPSFLMSDVSKSLRSLTKMSDVRELLRSLTKNEWPWANRSGLSSKMSEWANRSFFEGIAHSLIFLQKTSDSLRNPMSKVPALVSILWRKGSDGWLYPNPHKEKIWWLVTF